jgi:hypothetical protein
VIDVADLGQQPDKFRVAALALGGPAGAPFEVSTLRKQQRMIYARRNGQTTR